MHDSDGRPAAGRPDRPSLLCTAAVAEILGVNPAKVVRWIRTGVLIAMRTYPNKYGGTSYLLDEATGRDPATRDRLTAQIAIFQRRSVSSRRAVQTRVDRARDQHDAYLDRIARTVPTPHLADLLTAPTASGISTTGRRPISRRAASRQGSGRLAGNPVPREE